MTGIAQTIPNYIQGISEQPDELKAPGQLSHAINVTPDITRGLIKRPGSKLIKSLGTAASNAGCWFSYYRDESEQYIGKVFRDGSTKIWKCSDGTESTITSNSYLIHTADGDLQFQTINDYTYITNRLKTVAIEGETTARPNENCAYIELKQTANARQYALNIYDQDVTTPIRTVTKLEPIVTFPASESKEAGLQPTYPVHTKARDDNGAKTYLMGSCPDIGTGVFSTNQQTETTFGGSAKKVIKAVKVGSTDLTQNTNTGYWENAGYDRRKNLVFRFTVKGVSGPRSDANSVNAGIDYVCTYSYDVDLLSGGEGFDVGDVIVFHLDAIEYKVKVAQIETSHVKANIGAIRPEATPFDADTAVSSTGILGGLFDRITSLYLGREAVIKTDKVSTSENTITTADAHGLTTGVELKYKSNGTNLQVASADLADDTSVYAIKVDDTKFKIASSATLAAAGTALNITGAGNNAQTIRHVVNAQIIGNGIYLHKSSSFNIDTAEVDLLNIITEEVNDVSKLPTQCKHGYIVKVSNSNREEADDYYLKFVGDNNIDGPGTWVECPKPGIKKKFTTTTMPIRIKRESSGSFSLDTPIWTERKVGDDLTNPQPTFVGKKINKVLFWRNRLVFLCGENVILSEPGNFENFWAQSALTISPLDAIDIAASSTFPADLFDGIETNSGLVLFSNNQQFLLTTDSDILNPETAKIDSLCTYNYNKLTSPISLGTSYAFLDNAGKYSRFFEMRNVKREGEPQVLEQSKVISRFLPKNIDLIANSRENSYVMMGVSGKKDVYGFRYFDAGVERLQQAWFKWELSNNLLYHCILDDTYYAILSDNNFLSYELKDTENSTAVTSDDVTYSLHLDNYVSVADSSLTYNSSTNKTTFATPTGIDTSKSLAVYISSGSKAGQYAVPTVKTAQLELTGNWKGQALLVGYNFEMSVQFPKFYVTKTKDKSTRADVHASLTIHRVKLDLGTTGVYQTTLKRLGKADYTQTYESIKPDDYDTGAPGFTSEQNITIPIYDRNTNLTLTLKSKHPSPATLYSLTWEGDYSPKYYKRV